jgi:hypothetical protein
MYYIGELTTKWKTCRYNSIKKKKLVLNLLDSRLNITPHALEVHIDNSWEGPQQLCVERYLKYLQVEKH